MKILKNGKKQQKEGKYLVLYSRRDYLKEVYNYLPAACRLPLSLPKASSNCPDSAQMGTKLAGFSIIGIILTFQG